MATTAQVGRSKAKPSPSANGPTPARAAYFRLPPISPSAHLAGGIWFRSTLLRWFWTIYTQRLSKAGRWFLWPTVLFTGYAAVSLNLGVYMPFCYTVGLWGMAILAAFIWRPRVRVNAYIPDRVGVGTRLPVEIEVENLRSGHARDLYVLPHQLPIGVDVEPVLGVSIEDIAPGGKERSRLWLLCHRRGSYRLNGFRVESEFPSGLLRSWRTIQEDRGLLVYPRFTPLTRLEMPQGRRYQPGGIALASVVGDSVEYVGNREFREGDSIRNIDWRATARLNKPIVREYREEYFFRVGVILDTHVPAKARPEIYDNFERAVSMAAAISDEIARAEHIVDLFAAGPNLYHLTAGRSLAYLDQILDILACVEANPHEPFEILEPEIAENLAKITTVIGIFLDWDETRRKFMHRLQGQGVGVKVIIVRDTKCTLDPAAEGESFGEIPVISKADFEAGVREI